jgi:hypothetical protein
MGTWSRKKAMSAARISRSVVGMWPWRRAVTMSVAAWRSGGSVGEREGRVERVRWRMVVVFRVVRAVVRF